MNKDHALVDRYEEIRLRLFDRYQGGAMWGLTVLKTKGMAAWVKSWREYDGTTPSPMPSKPVTPVALCDSPNHEEIVRVLAGMVWAIQEEATP